MLHRSASLALAATLLAACSETSEGNAFKVRTSNLAAPLASPLVTGGGRFIFFAAENLAGTGVDLNGDGDMIDLVAHTARFSEAIVTNLGVATNEAYQVGSETFLIADEAEGNTDWNSANGLLDTVLLHWNSTLMTPEFVDVVDVDTDYATAVVAGTALIYQTSAFGAGVDDTTLRRVTAAAPTTPVAIAGELGAGNQSPRLFGVDEGLVFVALSEVTESANLNGDGDMTDEFVLALLDGTSATGIVVNTGLALLDADAPLASRLVGTGDWLVAALVDEADQGVVDGLNDHTDPSFTQPFLPAGCLSMAPDDDSTDQVLHWIDYADLLAGTPGAIGNTGLAGVGRVIAVVGAVATLSDEADASCDLNGDGDLTDLVARWVAAAPNAPYVNDTTVLRAVETTVPGGAMGLSWLDEKLVCAVSEAGEMINIDGEPGDHALIAWIDPGAGASANWTIAHPTGGFGTGVLGEPFAGATWLAPEPVLGRLAMTYSERVPNLNLNTNVACSFVQKDTDAVDALPVWADFAPGSILDFDGLGFAVSETAPGIVVTAGFVFFRVDEAADNRDWNDDGDKADVVLFRNPLTSCNPLPMATSSAGTGGSIVPQLGAGGGGAFLTSEASSQTDFNSDGDQSDFIVRWFSF